MTKQTDFLFGANVPEPDYHTHDPPTYAQACMGMMICPHCSRALMCGDITTELTVPPHREFHQPTDKEIDDMDLKNYRSKDRGKGKGKGYTRRDFLTVQDVPAKGGLKCKVIDFRVAPEAMQYSDFLLDVAAPKKEYTVGLRKDSVLLDMVIDELGTKSEKYPGKTITFVRGGKKGQYINVG